MIKIGFIYILCSYLLLVSCTQSGRRKTVSNNESITISSTNKRTESFRGKNVIKIKKSGGVYLIPTIINGINMDFIFDTGASKITISEVEALFLIKQGTLTKDDFLGVQNFQIADGSISEGSIINLRTVQIGNRVLNNVKASIVHNTSAPLLLGQSALNQFGQITIDYQNDEITLE
ncbi:retroviral-like aspartic protease family protein [Aureisphaera sp. CAU 1614]|uniref:Retroviral-like aspartic protease family protein n=1 Tax=Halomarinibacterium sedimenti TaxID=2857106 RepID=A0A9X1FMY8_9FLAO|nr:retropepsin-like aspartic protease [Halomarinibacterium sedimenti]MBW2937540.1 retroviral-like aspartic protease family protein [Halomarinibacterium sedimenti]